MKSKNYAGLVIKKRHWLLAVIIFILLGWLCNIVFFNAKPLFKKEKISENEAENSKSILLQTNLGVSNENSVDSVSKNERNKDVAVPATAQVTLFEKEISEDQKVSYKPQSTDEAFKFLQSKKTEDPLAEFYKLQELRIEIPRDLQPGESFSPDKDDMTFNFIGLFADKTANIKMFFAVDDETGEVAETSCLILKNEIFQLQGTHGFSMRHDGNGYAVIFADSRWHMRMKYVDDYGRFVGQLFKATENGWEFQESFDAVPGSMPRNKQGESFCERLKSY